MRHWPITSARLDLRPLTAADAQLYDALYTDGETMRFIGPPLRRRQAQRSFQAALNSSDPPHCGPLFITIIERMSQLSLGLCAIQQIANGGAETGVIISAAARCRGIATESLQAVIGWALATLPLEHAWVRIASHNLSAMRLVRAIGLVRQSLAAHQHELAPGEIMWVAHRNSWRGTPRQREPERFKHHNSNRRRSMHVLEFLERVGQDWQLRHAEPTLLAQAMNDHGITPQWHTAILDPDSRRLQALLELSGNVCCAVHPAHEEEDEDEDFDDEDEDDDLDDDADLDEDED